MNEKLKNINTYVNKNLYNIFISLLAVLLLILILNTFFVSSTNSILKEKNDLIKQANIPSKIQLSIINCEDCFDISGIVDLVKSKNVEITNEKILDFDSEEAKNLINQQNIKKLPFVLISGEIDKINFEGFELVNNAMILSNSGTPYFDIDSNELKGEVSIIEIIDSSCEDCVPLTTLLDSLGQAGVLISDWNKLEYNSAEAVNTIKKYKIKKAPTILISKDIDYYEEIKQGLLQLGLEDKEDYYEINMTLPPYRDLTKNKIVGLVDLIMLNDESCTECYDVELNKPILQRFGMKIENENIYDITSTKGKQLVSKYNIVNVPIIILSPEAKEYSQFVSSWKEVGTKETDNWFVMRKPEIIGTVKNIITNEVIVQEQQQASPQ